MIVATYNSDAGLALRQLAADFPREFRAGLSTLGVTLRGRVLRAFTAGQVEGQAWPALHPVTLAMRRKRAHAAGLLFEAFDASVQGFGGKLPRLVRYKVDAEKALRIGWFDEDNAGAEGAAARFQSSERRRLTRREHRMRRLLKVEQEREKIRPERPVITPIGESKVTADEAVRIVAGRIRSIIDKRARGK